MNRSHHWRLSRLEKLAIPAVDRAKQLDEATRLTIEPGAKVHARNFAAVALYGDPNPHEPLSDAWSRCRQASIWQTLQFPLEGRGTPFARSTSFEDYLERCWAPTLSGTNEKEKFDPIFANAPPWLIWFTFADWTADFLNYQLPDLSEMHSFARGTRGLECWPSLPAGAFEFCPMRLSNPNFSVRDMEYFRRMRDVPEEQMTRLERKRFLSILEQVRELQDEGGLAPH